MAGPQFQRHSEKGRTCSRINGVKAVNPVSKAVMSYDQQFVVEGGCDGGCRAAATITISPPIITNGAYQTVKCGARR